MGQANEKTESTLTDTTGRSFLSYRRKRSDEAALLIKAQREVGIPTWQDIENLDHEHTEVAIRRILADPTTANALLWLTPEVAESSMMQKVEAPLIINRHQRGDGFFLIPAAAGGLDYDAAAAVVNPYLGTADLREWNIERIRADRIGSAEAAAVARLIVRRRLTAVHNALPADEPLLMTIDTRIVSAFQPGHALKIDWFHHFNGREASPETWNDHLLPALETVATSLEQKAPNRFVQARGRLSIPAATALGATFLAPRQLRLGWWQFTPGNDEQLWSINEPREASGFVTETDLGPTSADDLAVLVSVSEDVEPAFSNTRHQLPRFRAITKVRKPNADPPHLIPTAGQAVDVAQIVVGAIREERRKHQLRGSVHLFMAVPVGMAMMIGQLLNTLGPVQTYEHIPEGAIGSYLPAALLRPAG